MKDAEREGHFPSGCGTKSITACDKTISKAWKYISEALKYISKPLKYISVPLKKFLSVGRGVCTPRARNLYAPGEEKRCSGRWICTQGAMNLYARGGEDRKMQGNERKQRKRGGYVAGNV